MKLRFFFLIGSTTLAFLFIVFTVYQLQFGSGDYYTQRAHAQDTRGETLTEERGNIYIQDNTGRLVPAAITKNYFEVFAVPDEVEDPLEVTRQLLDAVPSLDEVTTLGALSKKHDQYELLIPRATDAQVEKIKEAEIPGIYVERKRYRFYPLGTLAAHVLGFVGLSEDAETPSGRYGVEKYFNTVLTPKEGAEKGEDIVLTIDRNIQSRAEEILDELIREYKPVRGTIIVQEPSTGKILAMGNYPTFDPNKYFEEPIANFSNAAVEGIYEPGSIFKVLTVSAGIDSGAITPETPYNDTGSVVLNGRTIRNWDLVGHGKITITEGLEQSINTDMVFAEQQTGHETFYNYLLKFGIKKLTGITLPGEVAGRLTPLEEVGRDINFATASFGQGVAVTPIRLITAISAVANKGKMVEPTILAGETGTSERVIAEDTAAKVVKMMVSTVDKALVAHIPNYAIAGKTGTAQIPDPANGGYLDFSDGVIHTYVGFAPANNPRFTILIKLDKPNALLSGQTVVPAFRELTQFLLNYFAVPPTYVK